MLEPELEALAEAWAGRATIVKLNAEGSRKFDEYELYGTPAILGVRGAKLEYRLHGAVSREQLESILEELCRSTNTNA